MRKGLTEAQSYGGRGRPTLAQDGTAYSWTIGSHAPDGDVLASSDSVNGSWTYALNGLDQLSQACLAGCASGALGYSYGRYGNRWGASGTGTLASPALLGLRCSSSALVKRSCKAKRGFGVGSRARSSNSRLRHRARAR